MKSRIAILVIGIALQALVAVSRFLPVISDWWARQTTAPILYPIATIVSVHFALLTATILVAFLKDAYDRQEWQNKLMGRFHGPQAKPLSDMEFYRDFEARMKRATHSVMICYFAPYPPTEVNYCDRLNYYQAILKTIKNQKGVRFRRIIRDTPQNRVWAGELVKQLSGCPNADLALLRDDPPEKENPLALSVQVIDDDQVFLVALGGHDRDGAYRDLMIIDEATGALMKRYYERLWNRSMVILGSGRPTPDWQAAASGTFESSRGE